MSKVVQLRKRTPKGRVRNAQIPIRVEPSLQGRLREAAGANGRSLTQEIEHRLMHSFDYADAADYLRQALKLNEEG